MPEFGPSKLSFRTYTASDVKATPTYRKAEARQASAPRTPDLRVHQTARLEALQVPIKRVAEQRMRMKAPGWIVRRRDTGVGGSESQTNEKGARNALPSRRNTS